jgi:hypothetical protein
MSLRRSDRTTIFLVDRKKNELVSMQVGERSEVAQCRKAQ